MASQVSVSKPLPANRAAESPLQDTVQTIPPMFSAVTKDDVVPQALANGFLNANTLRSPS